MDRRAFLLNNLRKFQTVSDLERSAFFAECRQEIESILATPEVYSCADAAPRLHSFLRVVQWNIEKGKRYWAVREHLQTDEVLRWADVVLLNEVDCGMSRSGNLHIARILASALGMNMAYGPAHFELTKGTDEDLAQPGENRESLQGNAVLSRYPILEARILSLPTCFEPYEFHEKRYGRRNCVWARLRVASRTLWAGAVHLEVRNTPRCRAIQIERLMAHLPGGPDEPYLLGGDLNTNGFPRGKRWRTLRSIVRLLARSPEVMKERLRHPERGTEPLFRISSETGFSWEGLNSGDGTASVPLNNLEESGNLPDFLSQFVRRRLAAYNGHLCFRLDWLLGRGISPLRRDEIFDPAAGAASVDPGCLHLERTGPGRISDHIPIFADLRL